MAEAYSQLRGKRIFITGATGFIGSHLARRLVSTGATVYTLCRRNSDTWRLKDCLSKLKIVEGDITDKQRLISIMKQIKPQKCFHLAAYGIDPSQTDPHEIISTNIAGTINLTQALQGMNLECMVNFGTCFEYGNVGGAISENSPLNPNNLYAASKSASWLLCNAFHKLQGTPTVTIRLFTPYGPFEPAYRLIPNAIIKALQRKELLLTEGEQKRDYIFIDDVVEGCIRTATTREALGQTINLGTGKEHPVKEVVTTCLNLMGNPIKPVFGALPYRENEIFNLRADTKKAKEILGWSYSIELEQGLRETIEWYTNNFNLAKVGR
jgi:nucleoside-diphosphate-sugar epimerase